MTIRTKQIIIAVLSAAFLVSLIFVQWMEVARKQEEAGIGARHVVDSGQLEVVRRVPSEVVARHHRPLEREHARGERRRLRRMPPGRKGRRRRLRPLRRA